MANRPVFLVNTNGDEFISEKNIEFDWYPGFAISQKQKSVKSLHEKFQIHFPQKNVLEISSKSEVELGINLSAFNLSLHNEQSGKKISVEVAFQSSKVFDNGGPFIDILNKESIDAKRDIRLKNSGNLVAFRYAEEDWPLVPKTLFYDWLYLNAIKENEELIDKIIKYDAFTDIEFNPEKSINCQAKSAALFVSLYRRNLLEKVLESKMRYIKTLKDVQKIQLSDKVTQTSFIL